MNRSFIHFNCLLLFFLLPCSPYPSLKSSTTSFQPIKTNALCKLRAARPYQTASNLKAPTSSSTGPTDPGAAPHVFRCSVARLRHSGRAAAAPAALGGGRRVPGSAQRGARGANFDARRFELGETTSIETLRDTSPFCQMTVPNYELSKKEGRCRRSVRRFARKTFASMKQLCLPTFFSDSSCPISCCWSADRP